MAPFFLSHNFLEYLRTEKRYSEHTIIAYQKDLDQFLEHAGVVKESDVQEVNSSLVRSWVVDLVDNECSSTTINRKLSTLRSFFKWLQKTGVITINPTRLIKGPKREKRLPVFAKYQDLDTENMDRHFDDGFDGVRDRLMIETFYQTGIRLSELIELKLYNVTETQIKVLGKRNKERIIPISKSYYELVTKYLKLRSDIEVRTDRLFVMRNGKKTNSNFVYRKINSYLSNATDLDKKSPHILRHTFATHMLNNGAGLEVLKELLGHEDLTATQIYTHNSFAQLTQIYSQSHPRGHKN